ncbi:hypothetical protein PRNP1_010823 [Phytophthora ramorum]
MKLLHHLLASAICVAAVVDTSATPASGHAANVSYSSRQGESMLLRGPVADPLPAPGDNYDKAEDFPSPEDSEDKPEVAAEESEPVVDAGEELVVPEEDERELVQGNDDVLDYEVATGIDDEPEDEDDTEYVFRQLQSVIDPVPVMLETVTGPVSPNPPTDTTKPSDALESELVDPKPKLRGPEKEIEA